MQSRSRRSAVLIATATFVAGCLPGLAGCSSSTETPDILKAVQVVPVAGATPGSNLHRVTLSAEAITRLGIQMASVQQGKLRLLDGSTVNEKSIPFAAVIYDPQGQSWTYTTTGERTYVRTPITIDRIDGDIALLKSGPPTGTPVVTAGAPELLGAEDGVGEE